MHGGKYSQGAMSGPPFPNRAFPKLLGNLVLTAQVGPLTLPLLSELSFLQRALHGARTVGTATLRDVPHGADSRGPARTEQLVPRDRVGMG